MHHRTLTLLLLLCALLAPAASAPAQQAPATPRGTPLALHDGIVLLSRWDGTAYRLAFFSGGAITDVPGVRPQAEPFDADLGPDTADKPTIVVALDGDVFRLGLEGGTPEPVPGVSTPGQAEHHPTLWRDRIAFARGATTYVKDLGSSAPARKRSGLPAKRCIVETGGPACRPIERPVIDDLELSGPHVVQAFSYQVDGAGGFFQKELRLVGTTRRGARQLHFMTTGLGGQSFLGASVARGEIAWYVTCFGDPGGCKHTGGAYRYRYRDGRYQRALDQTQLGGWAWDARLAWRSFAGEAAGCQAHSPREGAVCPITTGRPAWRAMRAPKPVR